MMTSIDLIESKKSTQTPCRVFKRSPQKQQQNGAGNLNMRPNGIKYTPYLAEDEVEAGLQHGILIKGILRVNQRNFEQSFVDNPDGGDHSDLLILGGRDRNRAFHGDLVVVRLKPKDAWYIHDSYCNKYKLSFRPKNFTATSESRNDFKLVNYHLLSEIEDISNVPEECFKKTCEVVAILEQNASRRIVGLIKPMANNMNYFLFSPTDSRVPRLLIPSSRAPTGFYQRPQDFEHFTYLAQVDEWPEDSKMPRGKLLDNLGPTGEVDTEHKALLHVQAVDQRNYEEYSEMVKKSLPKLPENPGEWVIDPHEFTYRRDFRQEVVFTIDPSTARDLDDALHIKQVEYNNKQCWEVGVHIADVAYFLDRGTELDEWARCRGTSVYLVHQVIPMLPRILCEELCSLNPGVERLTFSVVWIMDDEANILHRTFTRSIIQSCAKLAYEHAQVLMRNLHNVYFQDIISNPRKQFALTEMPPRHCGRKFREIKTAVKNLDFIAKKLKAKRLHGGALKLDLPKLRFDVEKTDNGIWQPRGIRLDERKDANFLVEEFMLLANMEVARHLYEKFEKKAMLRNHPPPKKKELTNLVERCAKLGITINSMNSKAMADSLKKFERNEEFQYTVLPALNQMLMKCMHLARYFCTGTLENTTEFRHYALSVDFYTHFTSPIRRYPDVIVHRLLAASLGYCQDPGYTIQELEKIADRANQTKATSKLCSDTSGEIFFGALVRESGTFEALGVVMAIFDECFDFLLIKYAIVKRVYLKKQKAVKRIYYGKLVEDGPVSLVLLLHEDGAPQNGQSPKNDTNNNNQQQEGAAKEIDIEDEDERDVDTSEEVAPPWVKECGAEQMQTLNILSVARLKLVPVKNSVKYEAYLIPTPDSNPLTWMDAKEHMEDLPHRANYSAEDTLRN